MGNIWKNIIDDIRKSLAKVSTFLGNEDYISVCIYKKEAAAVGAALLYIRPFIKQQGERI